MSARNSMDKGKSMAASYSMEISKARMLSTAGMPTIEGRPKMEIKYTALFITEVAQLLNTQLAFLSVGHSFAPHLCKMFSYTN
jgi:hypothetical protein